MFPTTSNSVTDLQSALKQSQVQETAGEGGKAFLKFGFQTGSFEFGRDKEDITGEQIVINIASFRHGWTMWVNKSPKKVQASFTDPLPMPPAAEAGNEPTESRGFEAAFLDEDDDTIITFETNSFGGRKGADNVLTAVKTRASSGEANFLFPVVELTSESYQSKQGSTIHNPVFKIVDWMDQEGNMESATAKIAAPVEEESAEVEEAQPKRRRKRAAA